jgi:hypothetical protein
MQYCFIILTMEDNLNGHKQSQRTRIHLILESIHI